VAERDSCDYYFKERDMAEEEILWLILGRGEPKRESERFERFARKKYIYMYTNY